MDTQGFPSSGAQGGDEISTLPDGGAADKRPPTRLRRVMSLWYFAVPILSFGYLSPIPFFHASRRLGRKSLSHQAWTYTAVSVAILTTGGILNANHLDRRWFAGVLGLAVFGMGCLAAWQAAPLRAEVYGVPSKFRTFVREMGKADRADREARKEARTRGEKVADEPWGLSSVIFVSVIFVWIYGYLVFYFPIKAISISIAQESAHLSFFDHVYAFLGIAAVPSLIIILWGFSSDARGWVHWLLAGAAIVANIYFGFAVWVIAARWVGIEEVETDARRFGLMIWWNLVDSVPLVDIDSAFDWRRPMHGYGTTVGWLFLAQRVILVLTVARTIQVLATRLYGSTGRPDKDGGGPSAQPDGRRPNGDAAERG